MIEKATAYKVGNETFTTLAEAQGHELYLLIAELVGDASDNQKQSICAELVKQREKVIDILNTTDSSRPKARRINGATRKPRTPKNQPELPKA